MNKNPFVLSGFGQDGPMGGNPVLASMEMMRQAWEGLAGAAGAGAPGSASMKPMMSVEELDKRIADLRAIENWLRMNLSMLTSTIQGMEVQRATIATLQSFAETGLASMSQAASGDASPLEKTLAAWSAKNRPNESRAEEPPASSSDGPEASRGAGSAAPSDNTGAQAESGATSPQSSKGKSKPSSSPENADTPDLTSAAAAAAQGWWNMMQQQFQTLAAATAAAQADASLTPRAKDKTPGSGQTPSRSEGAPAAQAKAPASARASAAKSSAARKSTVAKTSRSAKASTAAKSSTKRNPRT